MYLTVTNGLIKNLNPNIKQAFVHAEAGEKETFWQKYQLHFEIAISSVVGMCCIMFLCKKVNLVRFVVITQL